METCAYCGEIGETLANNPDSDDPIGVVVSGSSREYVHESCYEDYHE